MVIISIRRTNQSNMFFLTSQMRPMIKPVNLSDLTLIILEQDKQQDRIAGLSRLWKFLKLYYYSLSLPISAANRLRRPVRPVGATTLTRRRESASPANLHAG